MAGLPQSTDTFTVSIQNKRDVRLTMPWFPSPAKYPPRPANVIEPLINGERAFRAVHEAISRAKKTVDIISWGFDPSMRLLRPGGERLGDLLRRKAEGRLGPESEPEVQVRILIWKNALANFGENNIIGDGLLGSGGGTAMGSGVGGLESAGGGAGQGEEFNNYGSKVGNSAAIQREDDDAKRFNRSWFDYLPPSLEFRNRDFSLADRLAIARSQIAQRGLASPTRTYLLTDFASHHQKVILVDYEVPEDAIGFVMGHNLLRNYWDTDAHEYFSEARLGFAPWQDLSCRVVGPVLYDLNENFMTAWDKAEGMGSKFFWSDERKARKSEHYISPARKHGRGAMAQICRTQPQESDKSILEAYRLALANARSYLYFENQYFRYKDFAELLCQVRKRLKVAGWKRDFHVFVVTNTTDSTGRSHTYEMLKALGQGHRMPAYQKQEAGNNKEKAIRKADLEGVNIHVATLWSSGQSNAGMKYKEIYVHSKLLLVDDVFFTLGSANVNVRSMETDSELNIACPSPDLTKKWRRQLWKIHTGAASGDDMALEFKRWQILMKENGTNKNNGKSLATSLVDFYDGESSRFAPD